MLATDDGWRVMLGISLLCVVLFWWVYDDGCFYFVLFLLFWLASTSTYGFGVASWVFVSLLLTVFFVYKG